ncbi:hypothetical protein Metfor_2345 [Methanoregula formicica SMSP]|uniref:Uncharacterized protein n=1 Tax=Methanoregula formicica (strain DSM 22288 / NBRC 105244 / SMSP) TaxID=593750 RepID=L0HJV6_METFS|nr:hypothetical protein Metfor_2345 [Methanoregula formicica SMSP]
MISLAVFFRIDILAGQISYKIAEPVVRFAWPERRIILPSGCWDTDTIDTFCSIPVLFCDCEESEFFPDGSVMRESAEYDCSAIMVIITTNIRIAEKKETVFLGISFTSISLWCGTLNTRTGYKLPITVERSGSVYIKHLPGVVLDHSRGTTESIGWSVPAGIASYLDPLIGNRVCLDIERAC